MVHLQEMLEYTLFNERNDKNMLDTFDDYVLESWEAAHDYTIQIKSKWTPSMDNLVLLTDSDTIIACFKVAIRYDAIAKEPAVRYQAYYINPAFN